jgi:hypothetical protein
VQAFNRVVVAVLGLLLLVGGVLAAIEIAVAFAGGDHWILPYGGWYRSARSHSWESGEVRGVLVVLAALGASLFLLQLVRRAPSTIALHFDDGASATYAVRRRSLERSLTRSAEQVDGVESARVKIDRRTVRVNAHSSRRLPGDVKTVLDHAMQARLRALEFESEPRIRLNLHLRKGPA